ncbi:hypothetical protein PVAG01_05447 [Phlyctema vagabunda]|uniref:Uncharacterized protein n=1 Tax=Phlyctema vagabunda TaxID=108571 RepID=A0ABR4PK56_9HELO
MFYFSLFSIPVGLLALLAFLSVSSAGLNVRASLQPSTCPEVFVLSQKSLAFGKALEVLGYSPVEATNQSSPFFREPVYHAETFTEISSDSQHVEQMTRCPATKSIYAVDETHMPHAKANLSQTKFLSWSRLRNRFQMRMQSSKEEANVPSAIDESFIDPSQQHRMLRIGTRKYTAGQRWENWPELCKFLGIGYSVVERLHLNGLPNIKDD